MEKHCAQKLEDYLCHMKKLQSARLKSTAESVQRQTLTVLHDRLTSISFQIIIWKLSGRETSLEGKPVVLNKPTRRVYLVMRAYVQSIYINIVYNQP